MDPRVEKGKELAEMIWWSLAKRIVLLASEHYKWDDDQLSEITDIFLKPSDYTIVPIN